MRISTTDRSAPSWMRREQRRMIGMVLLLGIVIVAAQWAARPESWHWLLPPDQRADEAPVEDELDFTVRDEPARGLGPDEVRVSVDAEEPGEPVATRGDDLVIESELLEPIRDNTLGVRHEESRAFYEVLSRVGDLDDQTLARESDRAVSFRQLMAEPDRYRGRLVSFEGDVKRLVPIDVSGEAEGFERLYEAWLVTADSGANPLRIVVREVPSGMPQGLAVDVPVAVTGYFFKREGYDAERGLHVAPLILGKRLEGLPQSPIATVGSPSGVWLVAIVLVMGWGVWRLRAASRAFTTTRRTRRERPSADEIAALYGLEPVSVPEQLKELEEAPVEEGREE